MAKLKGREFQSFNDGADSMNVIIDEVLHRLPKNKVVKDRLESVEWLQESANQADADIRELRAQISNLNARLNNAMKLKVDCTARIRKLKS